MSKTNSYVLKNGNTVNTVANGVLSFLQAELNMKAQIHQMGNGEIAVQGMANGGTWKHFIGMDKAITVKLSEKNDVLEVEIGEGKWIDKGLAMFISIFAFWPLAITSSVGFYQQAKIPEKIFKYILEKLV